MECSRISLRPHQPGSESVLLLGCLRSSRGRSVGNILRGHERFALQRNIAVHQDDKFRVPRNRSVFPRSKWHHRIRRRSVRRAGNFLVTAHRCLLAVGQAHRFDGKNKSAAAAKTLFGFRLRDHAASRQAFSSTPAPLQPAHCSRTSNSTTSPACAVADEMVFVSFTCPGVSFRSVKPATATGAGAWTSRGRAS
jgi:hypothetical protein